MDIAIRQEAGPRRTVANAMQLNEVTGSRGRETWDSLIGLTPYPEAFRE